MAKRSAREVLYFVLMAVMFYLFVRMGQWWNTHSKSKHPYVVLALLGCAFALFMAGMYYLSKLNKMNEEGFWDVSPAARCRGGPYMWQGDSETAKMCRKMAESPEGRCQIASYNCPTGYNGVPRLPFVYTPLSNDQWKNERCEPDKPQKCNGDSISSCVSNVTPDYD
jgi:hypothetical protein